ncbi:hypothetical protein LEN26_009415 [Aphanomyces euteiches]|nr:hypothetical protein LEN26_009415 [Aphanomyces euteiches]
MPTPSSPQSPNLIDVADYTPVVGTKRSISTASPQQPSKRQKSLESLLAKTQPKRESIMSPKKPAKVVAQSGPPKLLLAKKWEQQNIVGWWMSEKLDGVRGYWNGKHFVSRLGNVFHAPAFFTKDLPTDHHLDGELFMGRNMFEATVGVVKRHDGGDKWKAITFMAFDVPTHNGNFEARQAFLRDLVAPCEYVKVVEHLVCASEEMLLKELARVEALGAEGLMLRQPRSAYVRSRSSTLLKVKTFSDDEAIVTGYEKGKGKYLGKVGSLQVRNRNGVAFCVGSGLTDSHRSKPPKIGSMITYRYQELTAADVPRFPTFVGIAIDKSWD